MQLQKIPVARPMTLWRACCSARTVRLATSGTLRSNLHRRRVYQDQVAMLAHSSNAGQVMQDLNNLSMSKENPRMKAVKRCIDQAVCSVLGQQRATVQLQGSIAKGTGLKDSDWDFFVPLNHSDHTVTHKERSRIRVLLAEIFASNGIDYYMQSKSNRIRLWAGDDDSGPLPDVDTVFEGFKGDRKHRPNNKLLARSQEAQQVVKYCKILLSMMTNLPRPKSYLVERFVMDVLHMLHRAKQAEALTGAHGFDLLLCATLECIQGGKGSRPVRPDIWEDPRLKLDTLEWQQAAKALLQRYRSGHGWLRPVAPGSDTS